MDAHSTLLMRLKSRKLKTKSKERRKRSVISLLRSSRQSSLITLRALLVLMEDLLMNQLMKMQLMLESQTKREMEARKELR